MCRHALHKDTFPPLLPFLDRVMHPRARRLCHSILLLPYCIFYVIVSPLKNENRSPRPEVRIARVTPLSTPAETEDPRERVA